jgi:hypothetical protein
VQLLTSVAVFELFIEFKVPELGFRVRLSLSNDLEVELALNLAVQDLQLPISDLGKIQGKIFLRGEMQFLGHRVLHNAMPVSTPGSCNVQILWESVVERHPCVRDPPRWCHLPLVSQVRLGSNSALRTFTLRRNPLATGWLLETISDAG